MLRLYATFDKAVLRLRSWLKFLQHFFVLDRQGVSTGWMLKAVTLFYVWFGHPWWVTESNVDVALISVVTIFGEH